MRLDSCRRCGTELEINKRCNACSKPNQFFCHRCGHVTNEQIHFTCNLKSLDYKMLRPIITP